MWAHAPPRCSPGAARAASVRGDVGAAVNLFGRANALAPESDRFRKLLLVELGTVLYQTGELARARGVLDEAVVLARQTGDAHVEWRARILQSFLRMRLEPEGAGESALAEAELAMRALAADDDEARGRVWHLVAVARGWRAELDEQARAVEEGLRHARRARNPLLEAELLRVSVPALVNGPVPVQEGLRRVEAMLERSDDVQAAGDIALHLLGHLRARVGDFDGAREAFSTWRQHLQELGNELAYAASAMCIWDLYSLSEDWSHGECELREGYEILEQMGERAALASVAGFLGESAYRQGRLDEADRHSLASAELGSSDDRSNEALWRSVRMKVLAARGALERAEELAQAAIEIASRNDLLDLQAGIWLDLAEIRRTSGRAGMEAAARQALVLYERRGHVVGAARAKAMLDTAASRP